MSRIDAFHRMCLSVMIAALGGDVLHAETFQDFIKRDQEAMKAFTSQSARKKPDPSTKSTEVSTPPAPASASPATTPATEPEDAFTPLAPDAICKVAKEALPEIRQWLAPFASAIHYVARKYPSDESLLRVVFASPEAGEFLEIEMLYNPKEGGLAVGEASAISHGTDTSRLNRILRAYAEEGNTP